MVYSKIRQLLSGPKELEIPIVGLPDAGKTYFLLSLGYLVSRRDWGTVINQDGKKYLTKQIPKVLDEETLPATPQGKYPVKVKVNNPTTTARRNFVLSTNDYSGQAFKQAVESSPDSEFHEMYRSANGLIVILDITRGDSIYDAISEQISPVMTAMGEAMESNYQRTPVYLVATKRDVHGMSATELMTDYIDQTFTFFMDDSNVGIEVFSVSAKGWLDGLPSVTDHKSPLMKDIEDLETLEKMYLPIIETIESDF